MNYLNPFDLLNIVADDLSVIDSSALRKAKKALLAEIELNDSKTIIHNKNELTKSDCIRAIDELDDIDKKEFHFFIHQNKTLNNFLSNGDLS